MAKVNFNGGDLYAWPKGPVFNFRGARQGWPAWFTALLDREKITDILLTGEWRPLHVEAMDIARHRGLRVFVFEEGYLRPGYITMEEGGVNGSSHLPKDPATIRALAAALPPPPAPGPLASHSAALRTHNIMYHAMNMALLWPLFPRYKTHRPYNIWREVFGGWLPRLLSRKRREKLSGRSLADQRRSGRPYFLFPLQLDSDAQVRRYSPFSGMLEGISHILTSFAHCADPGVDLLVRNHPLDPGLINFHAYIDSYARALKVADRVYYTEGGPGPEMIRRSRGLVLLNSTIGLQALIAGKPVFYLGQSICAVPGLSHAPAWKKLDDFWHDPSPPDQELLDDFTKILKHTVLANGNFYNAQGARAALPVLLERLLGPEAAGRHA
ncbi:MAG: capsular biosynthesis protein [Candidatus Adiutrix sp.]|nr:capsular biosynthesis protein [Candidatus Adiutrix sp.]